MLSSDLSQGGAELVCSPALQASPAEGDTGTSHPHTTLRAKRMGWNHRHDSHGAGHSGTQECLGQPLGFTSVLRGLRSKSQGQLVASLAESRRPSRRPLAACLWKGVGQHLSSPVTHPLTSTPASRDLLSGNTFTCTRPYMGVRCSIF